RGTLRGRRRQANRVTDAAGRGRRRPKPGTGPGKMPGRSTSWAEVIAVVLPGRPFPAARTGLPGIESSNRRQGVKVQSSSRKEETGEKTDYGRGLNKAAAFVTRF